MPARLGVVACKVIGSRSLRPGRMGKVTPTFPFSGNAAQAEAGNDRIMLVQVSAGCLGARWVHPMGAPVGAVPCRGREAYKGLSLSGLRFSIFSR
jgi:hypothetical protein